MMITENIPDRCRWCNKEIRYDPYYGKLSHIGGDYWCFDLNTFKYLRVEPLHPSSPFNFLILTTSSNVKRMSD